MAYSFGQELNVNIKIAAPNITTTDPIIFQNLETSIKEFYNNTKWTNDDFDDHEKINASIQITITKELSTNSFEADLIVQSNRPVFNSDYNTNMINLVDKGIQFSYNNFQPIYKNDNQFTDNLSAILTYYAYIILGFDYESFSPRGGDDYFKLAQNTLNSVPTNVVNNDAGWNPNSNDRNRYWLIENIFSPRLSKFRSAFYDYHLGGLDIMADEPDKGRAVILSAVNSINEIVSTYPNSYLLNLFVDSKDTELVNVFKGADKNQKSRVYATLTRIAPSRASKYADLR